VSTGWRAALVAAVLLAAGLRPGAGWAAGVELEAFDLRKCLRWEIRPATKPVRTPAWRAARLRARAPLQPFIAQAELPEGGILHKYGACSLRLEGRRPRLHLRLRCAPGLDFPLAGASFVPAEVQPYRGVTTLTCASGCDQKIPERVYQQRERADGKGWRREDEDHARAAPFRRACASLR